MRVEKIKGDKYVAIIDKNKNILGDIMHIPTNNELITCYSEGRGERIVIGYDELDVYEKIKQIID